MYLGLNVKYLLFLPDLNKACIFSTEQSRSMRTDGRTDVTKQVVAFRNFANALKIMIEPEVIYLSLRSM
jgi:hypothetical protein